MKTLALALFTTTLCGILAGQEAKPPEPVLVHIGSLTLRPSGFVEGIGMSRSEVSADSVATKFGKIPLDDTPGETIGSARHSRVMLKANLPVGRVKFSAYMESDFMNFTPDQSPYRWRQYWGQAAIGKWEILGGQTYSLLRSGRAGIPLDKDAMNTDVIDPAYNVGLLGPRVRQVRIARNLGAYKAAVAWENDGNLLSKIARDSHGLHLEAAGLAGRFGRKGVMAAGVVSVTPRLRVVTQQYWSDRAIYQALGVMPAGVNGYSTLNGVEVQARKSLELFGYGGVVYASRSAGNRAVQQWTGGWNYKLPTPALLGSMLFSFQYSHVDRDLWSGKTGQMDFVMYRMRYAFN